MDEKKKCSHSPNYSHLRVFIHLDICKNTWIEFYTITFTHLNLIFLCPRGILSVLKVLFHSCAKRFISELRSSMESICSNKKAKCEQFKTDICSKLLLNNYCYYSSEYIFFVPNSSCAAEISPKHTDPALIVFKTGGEVKKTVLHKDYRVTSLTSREVLKQHWWV